MYCTIPPALELVTILRLPASSLSVCIRALYRNYKRRQAFSQISPRNIPWSSCRLSSWGHCAGREDIRPLRCLRRSGTWYLQSSKQSVYESIKLYTHCLFKLVLYSHSLNSQHSFLPHTGSPCRQLGKISSRVIGSLILPARMGSHLSSVDFH